MATTKASSKEASGGVVALTMRTARRALGLRRRPAVAVARVLLAQYVESGWVIGEAAALSAFFLFAFHTPGGLTRFLEAAYAILGVLAVFGGAVGLAQMLQPRVYRPLAERDGPATRAQGLALALGAVRLGSYLYLLSLALLTGKLMGASFGAIVASALGLLATVTLLSLVAVVLGPSVATAGERIAFLIWLVAALYSYVGDGFLAHICMIARLPLLPVAALFASGVMGALGWGALLALLVVAGYALGLVRLITWRLKRRPLTFDMTDSSAAASA